jgi:phosphopantetheine--protein transferase-like protein
MEEKIKEIVSLYIKIPANQIAANTIIDRSAVASSILLHRMYAALSIEGMAIENYWDIKTFGTLLQRINGTETKYVAVIPDNSSEYFLPVNETRPSIGGIGVDVEEIKSMPQVNDFREEAFYKMNFTSEEIAYCILQPDSLSSFAGLFAAKEAIVKADNSYLNRPFNSIYIDHLPNGKPVHPSFQLSISHTNELAIAVAMMLDFNSIDKKYTEEIFPPISSKSSFSVSLIVSLLTLLIVVIFIFVVLKKMS